MERVSEVGEQPQQDHWHGDKSPGVVIWGQPHLAQVLDTLQTPLLWRWTMPREQWKQGDWVRGQIKSQMRDGVGSQVGRTEALTAESSSFTVISQVLTLKPKAVFSSKQQEHILSPQPTPAGHRPPITAPRPCFPLLVAHIFSPLPAPPPC